ncbi:MAG: hypothetical protein ABIZ64_06645 [Casimicrobium sp.]
MATHFPTSHDGMDRFINGASAAKSIFSEMFAAKRLPTYVLAVTIMAVVTMTERALDAAQTGFAVEWAVLTIVALTTFGLLARLIFRGTRAMQHWFAEHSKHAQQTRSDGKMWATACRDPRVMNDILAAQGRADWMIDENPKHVNTYSVKDDGLAPLAPWPQFTRYY